MVTCAEVGDVYDNMCAHRVVEKVKQHWHAHGVMRMVLCSWYCVYGEGRTYLGITTYKQCNELCHCAFFICFQLLYW